LDPVNSKVESPINLDGEVTLRRASLAEETKLRAFLVQAYAGREQFKYPERWRWEFCANPLIPDGRLASLLAWIDGEIVGQTCLMYMPLAVDRRVVAAAHGVDLYVLAPYRRRGIGYALQRLRRNHADIMLDLWISDAPARLKHRLGGYPISATSGGCRIRFFLVRFPAWRTFGIAALVLSIP
jgi:GNAT superfamily N-acetyltransferase